MTIIQMTINHCQRKLWHGYTLKDLSLIQTVIVLTRFNRIQYADVLIGILLTIGRNLNKNKKKKKKKKKKAKEQALLSLKEFPFRALQTLRQAVDSSRSLWL